MPKPKAAIYISRADYAIAIASKGIPADVGDMLLDHYDMRAGLKKHLTGLAAKYLLTDMVQYIAKHGAGAVKESIKKSIVSNYTDVYEPSRTANQTTKGNQGNSADLEL
jgi:hypothetical protein